MSQKTIHAYLDGLSEKDKAYILSHQHMIDDIVEQNLDADEIQSLLSTAYFVDEETTKQQITIKISRGTLNRLKIQAKKEGLPYQTYINSLLYKFVH